MRPIDADALIKQRQFIVAETEGLCGDVVWVRDIQAIPTIEQKHGKWIESGLVDVIECSECGWIKTEPYWNFCPHCGASMERSW